MSTTTNLDTLTINYLTQAQYDAAKTAGTIDENQLYLTPDLHSFYQASGSGTGATALTADTMTLVTLVSTDAVSSGSGFSISNGGIKVAEAGIYRISASAYMRGTQAGGATNAGIYLRHGTGTADNATEFTSGRVQIDTTSLGPWIIPIASPKLVQLSANEIIYMMVRVTGGAGSVYAGNAATYLLVERVG